ncbi:MAG TPA: sugar ABC transporter ATP-binding protein, partial [Lachnospiraceae bacterium]|nr:sugar ABC transporter ATP-binding protein [Lachnospiraceae bacterium]
MKRNKKSPSRALRAKQAQVLKRILLQIRPHMPLVLLSLALAAVSVILTLYIPILIGRGVDAIISRGNVDFSALSHILITIVVCIIFTAVFQWFMGHINNKITYSIIKDMRVRAFDHLHELPLSYVDAHSQGDLLSRIVTDIETFSDGLLMGFTQLFTG